MLSAITLASKKSTIMHYTTALNASKKENDTNYRFEFFYACAVIVTSQSAKTTLLAWHYTRQQIFVYLLFLAFLCAFGIADADFDVSFCIVSTVLKNICNRLKFVIYQIIIQV